MVEARRGDPTTHPNQWANRSVASRNLGRVAAHFQAGDVCSITQLATRMTRRNVPNSSRSNRKTQILAICGWGPRVDMLTPCTDGQKTTQDNPRGAHGRREGHAKVDMSITQLALKLLLRTEPSRSGAVRDTPLLHQPPMKVNAQGMTQIMLVTFNVPAMINEFREGNIITLDSGRFRCVEELFQKVSLFSNKATSAMCKTVSRLSIVFLFLFADNKSLSRMCRDSRRRTTRL